MDLAGDIIQALCVFLNIEDLQVVADFPDEMSALQEVLVKVLAVHYCGQMHQSVTLYSH